MPDRPVVPSRADFVAELEQLLVHGAEPDALVERKLLLELESVRSRLEPPNSADDERALARCLKELLRECCLGLSGWKKHAAQDLFGLSPGSGAKSLGERYDLAGRHKTSPAKKDGITGSRIRIKWRPEIIRDLADQMYERECQALSINPRPGPLLLPESDVHGYKCISTERIYSISDDDPRLHTEDRISHIEVVDPGVTQFESWYKWSGLGRESDPVAFSKGHTISQTTHRSHEWKYYYVDLGGEQRVGSRIKIHTRQNLYDEHGHFDNYYWLIIARTQQWQTGVLRVRLPLRLLPQPEDVEFLTYGTLDHTVAPIKREPGQIHGPAHEIIWALPEPLKLEHRYEIRWRYPNGKGIYQIA
jgi:hypothetical protein